MLAQEEACRLNDNYIGTEHILLGLIHEGEGVAVRLCIAGNLPLGDTWWRSRRSSAMVGRRHQDIYRSPHGRRGPRAWAARSVAVGHNYIGTEHILLGLIREGEELLLKS